MSNFEGCWRGRLVPYIPIPHDIVPELWCCSSIFVSEFRLCAEVPLSKLISTIKLPNSTSTTPCQGPELKSAKNDKEKVTYNSKDTLMVSH